MRNALLRSFLSIILFMECACHVMHEVVTPKELNAHMEKYHGQNVVVKGYVRLAAEAHNMYESATLDREFNRRWNAGEADFDPRKYQGYCLTIANPELLYENYAAVNGKTLVVRGKFIKNYLDARHIDIGSCGDVPSAIILDYDDLRRRYGSLLQVR